MPLSWQSEQSYCFHLKLLDHGGTDSPSENARLRPWAAHRFRCTFKPFYGLSVSISLHLFVRPGRPQKTECPTKAQPLTSSRSKQSTLCCYPQNQIFPDLMGLCQWVLRAMDTAGSTLQAKMQPKKHKQPSTGLPFSPRSLTLWNLKHFQCSHQMAQFNKLSALLFQDPLSPRIPFQRLLSIQALLPAAVILAWLTSRLACLISNFQLPLSLLSSPIK